MIRRLNYTGRLRILREDAHVTIVERKDQPVCFRAELDLAGYGLPTDARVYVEAYRQTSWMRFDFGTVAKVGAPSNTDLVEFDSPEAILFRVRVTSSAGDEGKLLAEADRIRGRKTEETEEAAEPLLPVMPADLGSEVWRLDISDIPRLQINKELWDWKAVALAPGFVSLVYPAVLRDILNTVLIEEKHFDVDDDSDWRSRWLRFASLIPGVPDIPAETHETDKRKEWILDAVSAFCRQQQMLSRFTTSWRMEDAR
jgi:hypothetical protein